MTEVLPKVDQNCEISKRNQPRFLSNLTTLPFFYLSYVSTKEIRDEEPYYSTKISIFGGAGLAALHKASTI